MARFGTVNQMELLLGHIGTDMEPNAHLIQARPVRQRVGTTGSWYVARADLWEDGSRSHARCGMGANAG